MTVPPGSSVLVDAFSLDFTDFILQRIPLAVAYVMIVTYLGLVQVVKRRFYAASGWQA